MFALVCKDGADTILAQCDGILDVRVTKTLSELRRGVEQGFIDGVLVDKRLGITDALRARVQIPLYEFEGELDVAEVMRWEAQLRARKESTSGTELSSSEVKSEQEAPSPGEHPSVSELPPDLHRTHSFDPWRHRPAVVRRRQVPVLMLDSPKGGAGRSTLGAHTAYYAAIRGKRVAVIDLDTNGDIAQKFGFPDVGDVRGWRGHSIEEAVQDGVCLVHESGLHIFPSPQSPEVVLQSPEDAVHVLEVCLEEMDVVLLDMPQGWTPIHQAVLPYTTQVCFIVTPAVDQLARVQEHADKLVYSGLSNQEVAAVLNKAKRVRADERAMRQYLLPYTLRLVVPYDPALEKRGGVHGKRIVRAMRPFWDEVLEISAPRKRKGFRWGK